MNQRGVWIYLGVAAVLAVVGTLWLWNDFFYVDACLDAGGAIENGLCAGARSTVPTFFEAPWQLKALALLPVAFVAGVVVAAVGRAQLKGAL